MKRNKVFFLGCNYSQLPYLEAAKDLGYYVILTDKNADAPGIKLADSFHQIGYTDKDRLLAMAKSEGWTPKDKVFTAGSHFAYEGASKLAELMHLKFPSVKNIDICLDKSKFYRLLTSHSINVPKYTLIKKGDRILPDKNKTYYLKSDYGKSPYYCYKITKGRAPIIPKEFDNFYRKYFILQEAIEGNHYRVNVYSGKIAVFLKISDLISIPLKYLGPGHNEVQEKLIRVTRKLGLYNHLTKFDLIINNKKWYVIDLGMDPPLRMGLFCKYIGFDLPKAYTKYMLNNDTNAIPAWDKIVKPIIIKYSLTNKTEFIPLSEKGNKVIY